MRVCDIEMRLIQDISDVISLSNSGSHHYPSLLFYFTFSSFWCFILFIVHMDVSSNRILLLFKLCYMFV
jgi:hypothetical protein